MSESNYGHICPRHWVTSSSCDSTWVWGQGLTWAGPPLPPCCLWLPLPPHCLCLPRLSWLGRVVSGYAGLWLCWSLVMLAALVLAGTRVSWLGRVVSGAHLAKHCETGLHTYCWPGEQGHFPCPHQRLSVGERATPSLCWVQV